MQIEEIISIIARRKRLFDALPQKKKDAFIFKLLNERNALYRMEVSKKLGVTANDLRLFRTKDLEKLDDMASLRAFEDKVMKATGIDLTKVNASDVTVDSHPLDCQ